MEEFPPLEPVAEAPPELLAGGHLWLQERIDGAPLRFGLRESGLIRFGDDRRAGDADALPPAYRAAVRHVRERFDRDALRAAVPDVRAVTFFGVSTHHNLIDYDRDRLPPALVAEIHREGEGLLPPDAVEAACERLGLAPVNALAKEVRAVDFDPGGYEVPASAWYDGPAAGVVLRNKAGPRAELLADWFREAEGPAPATDPAPELADRWVTDRRVREALAAVGGRPTPEAVADRVFEAVLRAEAGHLTHPASGVTVVELEGAVGRVVRQHPDVPG